MPGTDGLRLKFSRKMSLNQLCCCFSLIDVCKCDLRRLHPSQLSSTQLQQQQDVAMDTSSSELQLPYNLYWRRKKINKKIVRELATDSSQICKCRYIISTIV